MSKKKKYTQGYEDMERVLEHLSDQYKKAQREKWLREHYSKAQKFPKTKEVDDASNSEP